MATQKVKASRTFGSVVGHVTVGDVFDLPVIWVTDYTVQGLVVVYEEPDPATFKTMKTKGKK